MLPLVVVDVDGALRKKNLKMGKKSNLKGENNLAQMNPGYVFHIFKAIGKQAVISMYGGRTSQKQNLT